MANCTAGISLTSRSLSTLARRRRDSSIAMSPTNTAMRPNQPTLEHRDGLGGVLSELRPPNWPGPDGVLSELRPSKVKQHESLGPNN